MQALQDVLQNQPQREPLLGRDDMVENSAGGYVFDVSVWDRLDRFLILGTEGGTYYIGQRDLTRENVDHVLEAIRRDGPRVVHRVVEISHAGRAPKNDQALFALALCAAHGCLQTQRSALDALPKVARIGTHLFQFVSFLKGMRGFGRSVKRALGNWYTNQEVDKLALQLVKYRKRYGWSHRDVLRLAHPSTHDSRINDLFQWATHSDDYVRSNLTSPLLLHFQSLQDCENDGQARKTILWAKEDDGVRLTHEMIPTECKGEKTWQTLLDNGMPMTALMRNLPTLTRLGLLPDLSDNAKMVADQLVNPDALRRARVHPMAVLVALLTYSQGHSVRGSSSWDPSQEVRTALEHAFKASFGNLPQLDTRLYVGVDVSGSMTWDGLMGIPTFTPAVASAALAKVLLSMTDRSVAYGFSDHMVDLRISKQESVNSICERTFRMAFGRTDCALPMIHALQKGIRAETFVIITDNETWFGNVHPVQALKDYRRATGIDAKLIVLAMESNGFTIADPNDSGMLDIVGFDLSVPKLIEGFIS